MDSDCATGICWDFNHYDALCFGAFCSDDCVNDGDCAAMARDAGAADPEASSCGADARCTLVGTGLGLFACAAN